EYSFSLKFDYAGSDDEYRVEKLVGGGSKYPDGRYEKPGVVVPIHLGIVRLDAGPNAEPIYEDTVETQGHYAHGFSEKKFHGNYKRMIAAIALKPGLYRIHVNTM